MSERSKHRVLVDFCNRCEVACRRKALPWLRLTICDGASQVGRHPQIEGDGLSRLRCHRQMILDDLVSFPWGRPGCDCRRGAARDDDPRSAEGRRSHHRAGEATAPPAAAWGFVRGGRRPWSHRLRNGGHLGRLAPSLEREDRGHPSSAAASGSLLVLGGSTRSDAHVDAQYPTPTGRSAPDHHERECIALWDLHFSQAAAPRRCRQGDRDRLSSGPS